MIQEAERPALVSQHGALAEEIAEYKAILTKEGELTPEEQAVLLDAMGRIGEGRLDKNLKYDREDIYFDHY